VASEPVRQEALALTDNTSPGVQSRAASSHRLASAESWARVVTIGLLASPAITFGVASLIVVNMGPPSPIWKWATGAQAWVFATPIAGVLQLIFWVCLPPRRWCGRLRGYLHPANTPRD
jgi:hypothetical protein